MKKPKNSFDLQIVPRHSKKKLTPYGDYDLDGSLNYSDCNPYDPSQDGALSFLKEKFAQVKEKVEKSRFAKRPEFLQEKEIKEKEIRGSKYVWEKGRGLVEKKYGVVKTKVVPDKYNLDEKVKKIGKKIEEINKGVTRQIGTPLSRTVTKTYYDKKTGKPYQKKVTEQLIKSSKGKFGGMTYSLGGGGLSMHSSKRRLKKVRKTAMGRTTGKPGRPKGSYKPRFIPGVGYKAIPAKAYYKILRRIKAQREGQAQATDMQQIKALAQRGIPPQQARQLVNQRQIQRAVVNPPRVQAPPIQPPQFNPQQFQQVEQQRIQNQVERWAQPNAQRLLQRRMELEQPSQPPQQRMEVSLLDGRARPVSNSMSRRERWTY